MRFYDRTEELGSLNQRWESAQPQLYVLWGRRRVGKTELLAAFLEGKRGFLYEATTATEADQLRDLTRVLAEADGHPLLAEQPLTSWEAALAVIEEYAARGQAIVALDEFQYIADATPEIGSLLSRWWREKGRKLPVFLILSGSEVSFFERDVLGASAPLYGRRTGQQQLLPFGYRDAGLFFPRYRPEDRIRAFAVCGGMPYYLEQFEDGKTIGENILRSMLEKDGVLREEGRLLLSQELPDSRVYFSILRSLAAGANRVGEIANRTGLSASSVSKALDVLQSLRLVRKLTPVGSSVRGRVKQTSYELSDGYLRFWFRFVLPYEDRLLTSESARRHLEFTIMPALDEFVAKPAFETVAREFLCAAEQAADCGNWWGRVPTGRDRRTEQREVDAVGLDGQGRLLATGTCKWAGGKMGIAEEELLRRLDPHVAPPAGEVRHYFFSRGGFDAKLTALAKSDPDRYVLISPRDLYA